MNYMFNYSNVSLVCPFEINGINLRFLPKMVKTIVGRR